ncbi:MAG TPA: bifunctional riboflavin kinase/FAD synthetase [Nitrospiria bacterium]|nr:bifunctional riboflavin kinase/FAD synthetase [Nitrospiria bacterium]
MEIIRDYTQQDQKPVYPVVAIGNFDGVHRGHQAILRQTVDRAKTAGGTGIVLTFEPHPLKVLAPAMDLKFLMTFEERLHWMETMGIRQVRLVSFTHSFASLTPPEFARTILRDDLGAKEVFVGAQFAFGKERRGTITDLSALGHDLGFQVHPVEAVSVAGSPVSSSRIRECLLAGRVAAARELLGRSYRLEGRVIPGTRRGRALGYPTANFRPSNELVIPSNGIYAVQVELKGRTLPGVSYIGTQPTLGPLERMVETHLFEPQPDLYDQQLRVAFVEWIRPEQTFKDERELLRHMEEDIRKAKAILATTPVY